MITRACAVRVLSTGQRVAESGLLAATPLAPSPTSRHTAAAALSGIRIGRRLVLTSAAVATALGGTQASAATQASTATQENEPGSEACREQHRQEQHADGWDKDGDMQPTAARVQVKLAAGSPWVDAEVVACLSFPAQNTFLQHLLHADQCIVPPRQCDLCLLRITGGAGAEPAASPVLAAFIGFLDSSIPAIQQGEHVTLVGTPYGVQTPKALFNAITRGVVCSVAPQHQQTKGASAAHAREPTLAAPLPLLGFTDARFLPGLEGAPVLANGVLAGILVLPIVLARNDMLEMVPFLPISSIRPALRSFLMRHAALESPDLPQSPTQLLPLRAGGSAANSAMYESSANPLSGAISQISPHLVLLMSGATWGSGTIVSRSDYALATVRIGPTTSIANVVFLSFHCS